MPATPSSIIALDVGAKRVGVAVTTLVARLPRPLQTLERGDNFFTELKKIIDSEAVNLIVVGLPRGLQGQHTKQTQAIEDFTEELKQHSSLAIHFQDEALTSHKAEEELEARGKAYKKADIDALAATYILNDFLIEQHNLEELAV